MIPSNTAGRLADLLEAAGLTSVVATVRIVGGKPEVIMRAETTAEQRRIAATVIAAFDARPRRPRHLSAIQADVDRLTDADVLAKLRRLLAREIQRQPNLDPEIAGDEPDA